MRGRLLALSALLCACASPGALPSAPSLRDTRVAPMVPDDVEHAAADVAAAALAGDVAEGAAAVAQIDASDEVRDAGPTGLAPAATDLLNASAVPGRAYREAAAKLLDRDDLDPALRERIERQLEDDPLAKANARVRDARVITAARAFNHLVEPIGQSLLSTAMAPYRLARSLVVYGLELYRADPLPLERRQALAHWKEFMARHPAAPEYAEVAKQAEAAQIRWHKTRRRKALRSADAALESGRPREALVLAERALRHSPEYANAERTRALAEEQLLAQRAERARSLRFALPEGDELAPEGTRELAAALLLGRPVSTETEEDSALAAELRFAHASQLAAAGFEQAGWDALHDVADRDSDTDNMVRHAKSALADPVHNPYDTFVRARWRDRRTRAAWLVVGPFAERSTPTGPEDAVQTLLELPRMLQVVLTLPLRLLQAPWMGPPKTAKVTAVEARRYLRLEPDGVHADDVRDWLQDFESDRDNYLGALRIAEARDPEADHTELRELAADQTLRVARKEQRTDIRYGMLTGVTRRFPNTRAGDEAGRLVRKEMEAFTPQRIRISRGFLEENPEVAGVRGLDLDPALLDGNASNGELHPDGLALVGGRAVEIAYVGESGDPEDEASSRQQRISEARLARLVARLEETSFENALIDDDDPVRPDAYRDHVFERARLGLSNEVDWRATARSGFTYKSMRERYGMVRRREPILPFDIVVQGSLADLSLGAFPRMRVPKRTQDALLYE